MTAESNEYIELRNKNDLTCLSVLKLEDCGSFY